MASQGAFYTIIVLGIQNIRVWYGPLPFEMCYIQVWFTNFSFWCFNLILFLIYLTKFTFICIWKRMKTMDDNMIVRIVMIWVFHLSIWVNSVGFLQRSTESSKSKAFCTGIYNDHDEILNSHISPKNLPRPFMPLFYLILISTFVLMVAIRKGKRKICFENPTAIIQRPKDMENMLLHSTVMVLFIINQLGYFFYWKKYVYIMWPFAHKWLLNT